MEEVLSINEEKSISTDNQYSTNELNYLREMIENMNKFNQIEILRILNNHKDSVTLNENKYGVHINLTDLKKDVLDELSLYIKYVTTQEYTLSEAEQQKESYRNTYFAKDIRDNLKK
jgi:hypothetical protein